MSMFNDIGWDVKGNDELCINNSKTIKEYAERFSRGHWSLLGFGSEKKWYGNLRLQTRWVLESNCRENVAEFPKIWSPNIPLYQCHGERTIWKQRRRKDNNTFHSKWWQCSVVPKNGHLRQSAQSLPSSSGFDQRITRWSKSCRETCCTRSIEETRNSYTTSSRRSASQWRATGKTSCKNMSNDLRNYQKTRSYPDYVPKQVWDKWKLDKSKFVTLTPNTNSQTFWPKGISHVMSGTIFFICSISVISAILAAPRISPW